MDRTWQCGTVQLDFQMPQNFNLEYTDHDGSKKRPVMLHRVCFGSVERFIGILIEHYAGKFPVWLAPTQVKILPVSEKSRDYAHKVAEQIEAAGIRVTVDNRDEKIGYKIREARSIDRVPYMLILGEKEAPRAISRYATVLTKLFLRPLRTSAQRSRKRFVPALS